jgi:RNA polymerase sigma-70 factor (ECF subfamily)
MTGKPDPKKLKAIERAIRKLPRRQRDIFCAIRFEDLSYEELARRTGLTPREVERQFAGALCNLTRRLGGRPKRWWQRR